MQEEECKEEPTTSSIKNCCLNGHKYALSKANGTNDGRSNRLPDPAKQAVEYIAVAERVAYEILRLFEIGP